MTLVSAQKSVEARGDASFSREELEGILLGLAKKWARESQTPQSFEVLFRGLSVEELEAITRFFLS